MAGPGVGRRRRGSAIGGGAAAVLVAGLVAAAVWVPGYDVQDIARVATSVWVTRDDGQYARVNTTLHEFDAVKAVAEPAGLVQDGQDGIVFTQGYLQAWPLDPTYPVDLVTTDADGGAASGASVSSPTGTDRVLSAGSYVLYLTSAGEAYLGGMPRDGLGVSNPAKLDPFAGQETAEGEEPTVYRADAAALDADGRVILYSGEEGGVREYDAARGGFVGDLSPVPTAPEQGTDLTMTMAGGRWALYSASDSLLWFEGLNRAVETGLGAAALLQAGDSEADAVLMADATGLWSFATRDGAATQLAQASGTPAAPVEVAGVQYGAWVDVAGGTVWSSAEGDTALAVEPGSLDDVRVISPVFRSNGDAAVLTETSTGMVWTLPDGSLIPTSAWEPLTESEKLEGTVQVDDVVEQEPPVAADDAFGVRRGALVMLPLLLNDSDPNKKDVLTVSAPDVSGLSDASFGEVGLVEDDQQAVVRVSASSGSATFTYAATDGYATSNTATVTLTVIPDDQNTAPQWCPMDDCTQQPPQPQVSPGGYVELDALSGWVDAEGDAVALADARPVDPQAPVTVVPTADGTVVIRHTDPNGPDASIPLLVTVTDSYGARTDLEVTLRVTQSPTLEARPIAVTASAGETVRLTIADWVAGGSGSYRLVDASSSVSDELMVSPSPSTGTIEVSSQNAGLYSATYTVEDTQTLAQQSAVLRVTVPPANRALIAAPMTTFVRPGEDTTVDVLQGVRSSSGNVLVLEAASTSSPDLAVGVVDQTYLRVSAATTASAVGPLGVAEVVVGDGTGDTTSTQVTVFLLQPSRGVGPVAAPDAISVRAGEQIDIPVLANDSSPRGERLLLSTEVVGSGAEGELAFANGSSLRYLAPEVPGVYTLTYSTYLDADAARTDSAEVTVTVLPAGSNRAPQPPVLEARVIKGQSVTIPVPIAGTDPDGDRVVVVDVTQPGAGEGVASVSASAVGVTYRAPAAGVASGQVTFTYTVRDASGETGTGAVKVGVLDSAADVAPVTYADRVAVQRGSVSPITVAPLINDHDPARGELTLLEVRPNAIPDTDEYARLEGLIDPATSLDDGTVVLRAGSVEGTASFVYTVRSSSTFSTAQGLIVLTVSDNPAPDSMIVTDTILTAQNRHDLAAGVDVVTGKVQWPTGDVGALRLSLWGSAAERYRVVGTSIAGEVPELGDLIPFALSGTDATGVEVTSYGFLRVPAYDDLRLQIPVGTEPIRVGEEQSVTFSLRELLRVPDTDVLELRDEVVYDAQRANAVCAPAGGETVTYDAGREAPWSDTCSVPVRLAGQSTWSIVAVRLIIEPKDPQAILSPVSRTITPGDLDTVALLDEMLSWEGGRVGDIASLRLASSYQGSAFQVSQVGDVVSIQALADARPGTRETIIVETSAYGGLRSAITLVVGAALPDAPYGATFTQVCTVSNGPSCTLSVVGVPNEYDPYAGSPNSGLTIAQVGLTGTVVCDVATVTAASETQLVATWPAGAKPLGGECVVDFTVMDAQGKIGPGRLTIDVQGYPPAPAAVTTKSYTGTSVTLSVRLGDAALTRPAVTNVTLYEAGVALPVACVAATAGTYECTVTGLVNGERHTYTARATNAVGESADSSPMESWSYSPPEITSVSGAPVYRAAQTTTTQGVVQLTITAADDVKGFRVENSGAFITRRGATEVAEVALPVGDTTITVVPVSQFTPPVAGTSDGASQTTRVLIAGSPFFASLPTGTATDTEITVTGVPVSANFSALPTSELYMVWTTDAPTCTMAADGTAQVTGATAVSTTGSFTGLDRNTWYSVGMCGSNGYGATLAKAASDVYTWVAPAAPSGTTTYSVSNTPSWDAAGAVATYGLLSGPSLSAPPSYSVYFRYDGGAWTEDFALDPTLVETITAASCKDTGRDGVRCGDEIAITPAAGRAPTTVTVTFPSACVAAPAETDVQVSQAARGTASVTFAATATDVTYTVTWPSGAFASLAPASATVELCPAPEPPTAP